MSHRCIHLVVSIVVAMCVTSLVVVCQQTSDEGLPQETAASTWMLLEVTSDGDVSLVAAKPSHQPRSPCRAYPSENNDQIVLRYIDPDTGGHCILVSTDPRKEHYDHFKDDGVTWGGGVKHHDVMQFALTVHARTTEFETKDLKNPERIQKRHLITQAHRDYFQTLQSVTIDKTQVQSTTIQIVGPVDQQKNIVFLSSGYKLEEKAKFDTDVQRLVTFMQQQPGSVTQLSSQPYRRYFSNINLFKIWYPSAESGASHPGPAGSGVSVANNLDCTFGATSARILTCSRTKVQLLGSYAPPDPLSNLLMVLVNDDNMFGGTGGARVCTAYTGPKMPVIFIHEIGHAGANLADEYDYGYSESREVPMLNCHWSDRETPWQEWVFAGILPRPTPVCTYSNYYKPTPAACLMESEQPSYCPVCAQTVLQSIFDHGMNLASPRYPSQYERIYVAQGEGATLIINNKIPYAKDETGGFDVAWTVKGYSQVFARSVHLFGFGKSINGSGFMYNAPGDYEVNVTILDKTNMFLDFNRAQIEDRNGNNATALRQMHTFRITVYDRNVSSLLPNCTWKNLSYAGSVIDTYCAQCDLGHDADCSLTMTALPLESALDVSGALAGLQEWLLGIGGVFVAIGIMIFILVWRTMALHAQHNPREILPFTPAINVVRYILLVVQVVLLIGSSASVVFSIYMYGQLSIFGRTVLLGIIAASVVVWFASFVGFCAAYYRNRSVLFINFVLLLLLFGIALLFTTLLLYMLFNIDTDNVRSQLNSEWMDAVANSPKAVCTLESVFKCSGFNTSCDKIAAISPQGTSNCPTACELSNLNGSPCLLKVRDFVISKFGTASIGGIVLCVFILAAMVLGLVLGCSIKSRRAFVHRQRQKRHQTGQSTLTVEEIAMLRSEFSKVDRDGNGDVSRAEFGVFYNAVMGTQLTPRELEEYFDKLDSDGNGVLSFEEFLKVYVPQKESKRKSLAKTKSMIYAASTLTTTPQADAAIVLPMPSAPGTAQSQRAAPRQQDIELDLVLEEDGDDAIDMGAEEAAEAQEQRARDEATRVAEAQAERQKRLQMDRPSNIDVDLVLDDMGLQDNMAEVEGEEEAFDNMEMDLDIDLDDEQFE